MDILTYRRFNGYWQVTDLNGNMAEGKTKEEAKRMYYLCHKIDTVENYYRKNVISVENLSLDK